MRLTKVVITMVMRVVMELLRYSQRGAIGEIGNANGNGSGASLGMGGDNLKGSFGFKLDTWHNTGNPLPNNKASADPKYSGYQKGAFGGFTYNYNGSRMMPMGSVTLLSVPLRS